MPQQQATVVTQTGPSTRNAKDPAGTWPVSPYLAQLHARHRALIVQKRESANMIMQGKSAQKTGKRQTNEQQNKACKQTIWHALQVTASNWHPLTNGRHVQSTRGASPQKCHHTITIASTPPRLPDVNAATKHALNTQHKLPCIHRGTPSLTQAACSHTAQVHPEHQCALQGKDVSL